jgi:hypothetical protein
MRKDYSKKEIQGRVGDVVTTWGYYKLMMFVSNVLCNHYFKHATEDQIDTLMEDADRYDEVHIQLLKEFGNAN